MTPTIIATPTDSTDTARRHGRTEQPMTENPAQVTADNEDFQGDAQCAAGCPVRWVDRSSSCPLCQGPAKPRRGRVARAPGATVRRYRVTMTDEEHAALKRAAVEQGCKVADLIRRIAPVSPRASQ